ncbi:MAG: VWA domain-containing protein [Treponema sp.]|jgi:Ca-activated chloride channel family protein|nr:VWA domain-containing protein [Treponema sp.]
MIFNQLMFDHPQYFYVFFLLIPVILLMIYRYVKQQKVFIVFLQKYDEAEQTKMIRRLNGRYVFMSFFFVLFLVCIIIALTGPLWGYRNVTEHRRGIDVVFAMDVSRSMNAQDALPSRLIRASLLAQELVKEMPGTRFAVAIAKGSGVLAVPLTDDPEAILACLNGLSSSAITSQGTNLESLILASISAFQNSSPTQRRIIVFSDGEAHAGNLNAILKNVQDTDAGIISVGLGLEEGSPIPIERDVLRNPDGSIVMSSLHPESLKEAAERSGGIYIDGNQQDALARLKDYIQALSSELVSQGFRREQRSWWHLFVIFALLAYGISKWIELYQGRKKR